MTLVSDHTETDDMRTRIEVTAEKLFRELGYQKTTVADIAKLLRMSPANVYRFFDSKKSIHEGVARALMGEVELEARRIVAQPGPAKPKLRQLLTTINHMNTERYVGDSKLHEMVAIAMEEDWDVCVVHIECVTGISAQVIAQGVASGEFEAPDLPLAALCTCTGMIRFFHPQMIAQAANKPTATIDQMIDFLFRALEPRAAK